MTPAEQHVLHTVRASREQCVCGEIHDDEDSVTLATIARMKAYLTGYPGHQFVIDDKAGIIAVVIVPVPGASGPLRIIAQAGDLLQLLNDIGAPPAENLS